ncbi:hypothetical protein SAMN04488133_0672 [Halobellus limi]|uniref:DUF7096 domain-containing protein n=2 Tax=Halobellus limi TaxID=699433 RepID=A0A1H5UPA0_9EURY|nr:hypothetical protein SAMN04488133_0672 [Halobellus limi]
MWFGGLPAVEMRPASTLLVALVVVVAAVPVGVAASTATGGSLSPAGGPVAAQVTDDGTAATNATETETGTESSPTATPSENASEEADSEPNASTEIAPGAKLAGVVAVQRTEIDSEVGSRAFGQRVAAAATNESKAAVIAENVNDSRERIETLRDRLAELERARESGEISEGRYRAQTAQVTAEINSVERRLDQANESASSLPAPVREAKGIDASNIERLRTDARNLSGPETAAIAREIAGDNPGRGMGDAPGRSGDAPGRDGDTPGRSGDVPGRSDGPAAGNESEDRRPEEAGNGDAGRADGSNSGTDGDGAPGRSGDPGADNDRREKNASRNDADESAESGDDDGGNDAGQSGDGDGDGGSDGSSGQSGDGSGQGGDAPGRSGDAPGRDRGE